MKMFLLIGTLLLVLSVSKAESCISTKASLKYNIDGTIAIDIQDFCSQCIIDSSITHRDAAPEILHKYKAATVNFKSKDGALIMNLDDAVNLCFLIAKEENRAINDVDTYVDSIETSTDIINTDKTVQEMEEYMITTDVDYLGQETETEGYLTSTDVDYYTEDQKTETEEYMTSTDADYYTKDQKTETEEYMTSTDVDYYTKDQKTETEEYMTSTDADYYTKDQKTETEEYMTSTDADYYTKDQKTETETEEYMTSTDVDYYTQDVDYYTPDKGIIIARRTEEYMTTNFNHTNEDANSNTKEADQHLTTKTSIKTSNETVDRIYDEMPSTHIESTTTNDYLVLINRNNKRKFEHKMKNINSNSDYLIIADNDNSKDLDENITKLSLKNNSISDVYDDGSKKVYSTEPISTVLDESLVEEVTQRVQEIPIAQEEKTFVTVTPPANTIKKTQTSSNEMLKVIAIVNTIILLIFLLVLFILGMHAVFKTKRGFSLIKASKRYDLIAYQDYRTDGTYFKNNEV